MFMIEVMKIYHKDVEEFHHIEIDKVLPNVTVRIILSNHHMEVSNLFHILKEHTRINLITELLKPNPELEFPSGTPVIVEWVIIPN